MMRLLKYHPVLALPIVFAACSSSTSGTREATQTTSSAISPEASINSVQYVFQLENVGVISAWNDIEGGNYVEYAALGASVQPFVPPGQTAPVPAMQGAIEGCSLGAVPVGSTPPPGNVQFTLSGCKSMTSTGGPVGSSLEQIVTLHNESDAVTVGVALENIETTPVAQVSDTFGSDLGLAGSALSTAGKYTSAVAIVPPLAGAAAVGGAFAAVGSVLSTASGLFPPAPNETACTGGLISAPAQEFRPGTNTPNPPLDTLYFTYTAAQLEAMTNESGTGSFTVSTNVNVTWPSALPGDNPAQCDSMHQINLKIWRVPNVGPAADPLSGSIGVARTATEVDGIVADAPEHAMAEMQWTPSNGWASYMITPSSYSPGAYTPVASLSRQVPPLNGSFTLVPASGTSPATTNLQGTVDSFWFDASGGLHWTYSWPGTGWITNTIFSSGGVPSGRLAATSRTPTTMDVFWVEAGGELAWFDYPADAGAVTTTGFATSGVASGVAPAGAGLAAVSRAYNAMDVLYIGTDGTLYDQMYNGTSWTPTAVGPVGNAPPGAYVAAVARDANTIDAFYTGNGGEVYWARYAATPTEGLPVGWQTAVPISGTAGTAGGPIAAISRVQAGIDVVYLDGQYAQQTGYTTTSGWSLPAKVATPTLVNPYADLSLVAPDSNDLALFYTDFFDESHEGTWNQTSGVWTFATPALPTLFSLSLSASSLTMSPEEGTVEDGVFDVLVTGSAGQTVTLAASGLPSGASLSFSPATVATGSQSSVLVLAGSAPLGTYTITITATGANSEGFAEVTMPVTLGPCIPYTITCSDACGAQSNGCGGTVECGGCPTGKTCQEGTCKLANCTTPECECVQSGGEWDGKYCE